MVNGGGAKGNQRTVNPGIGPGASFYFALLPIDLFSFIILNV